MPRRVADEFEEYVRASFDGRGPDDLPVHQKLAIEDAFYAGAMTTLHSISTGELDPEVLLRDLQEFGKHIVQRYKDAGLDV